MPTWGGTAGATGTGATKQITFNTTSTSASDYKTVIAGNPTAVTVNVIVYELTGTLTPQYDFSRRSKERYGVSEVVDLNFTTEPALTTNQTGNLTWSRISGSGTVQPNVNGVSVYTAPITPSVETLKLEIVTGPSKGLGPTYTKNIIAPSGATAALSPPPNVAHLINTCSVAMKIDVFLLPKDVSFTRIGFIEDLPPGAPAQVTGYYSVLFPNPPNHAPAGLLVGIESCNSTDGCYVFTDRVGVEPGMGYPTPCTAGDFIWVIPWYYKVTISSPPVWFMNATHFQTNVPPNGMSISKVGVGPITRYIGDPSESFPP
jgi:hypothetical protein